MLLLLFVLSVDDVIVKRNIFCSGCSTATSAAAPKVELLSTLVCPREPAFSRALLREGGEMHLLGPGDSIGGARLSRVMAQSVELTIDGRSWRIPLRAGPPAAATATTSRCEAGLCTLERAEVEKMVTHPELLGARAVATPDGFILRFAANSPLRQLGLKDGDRLRAVDGVNLDGMDAVLHLWPKLRKSSRFTLSLVREGKPLTWEVAVN